MLLNVTQERLQQAEHDQKLLDELAHWRTKIAEYHTNPTWFDTEFPEKPFQCVAYFSMEFGLSEALPIYSGGLGMLAGDHLKSASDLGIPLVGVGLLYQQGYFRQVLGEDGTQREAFPYNDPSSLPVAPLNRIDGSWRRVALELPGRTLYLRVWHAKVGRVPLYLLDSNDPLNIPWDRGITANLYGAGRDKRLLQEIVLGVGGWRLMEELELDVDVCHLNEGHAAFAVLARAVGFARRKGIDVSTAFRATRAGNVFTTHTPVPAAFDEFDPGLVSHYAMPFIEHLGLPVERVLALGRANPHDQREPFNVAFLAMRGACHVNAVSRLHGQVSRRLFTRIYPGWPEAEVPVGAITNGVHIPTWNSAAARRLWLQANSHSDPWLSNLNASSQALAETDPVQLWQLRAEARKNLIAYVRRRLSRQLTVRGASAAAVQEAAHVLDPNALTLGFARRFTEYKRPNLMLHDEDRLARLLKNPTHPVQLIVAGKAHPNDSQGKSMVRDISNFIRRPGLRSRIVFLEDYDMTLAQRLAAGVDVWLNTPRRPAEACGTSGMKILVNGGLNLSVRDGWWDETWAEDVGWQIGGGREDESSVRDVREAEELYQLLEESVIPEFYDRDANGMPDRWMNRVQASMSRLTASFSSERMLKDYVKQSYQPAAEAARSRVADGAQLARELHDWNSHLADNWRGLRFDEVRANEVDGRWQITVQAYLGDLDPESVRVEIYAEGFPGESPVVVSMNRERAIPGAVNGFRFTADVPGGRPAGDYTPRIVPWHPAAFIPTEDAHIAWQH